MIMECELFYQIPQQLKISWIELHTTLVDRQNEIAIAIPIVYFQTIVDNIPIIFAIFLFRH